MKKIYYSLLEHYYPKKDIYNLAYNFGDRLCGYLGEEKIKLLLDSRLLIYPNYKKLFWISDKTYQLHPAAKALEGFLKKLIKGKNLKENDTSPIGAVFGKQDLLVRQKIKNKKLIAKTKTVWDFCRNDIMHFSSKSSKDIDYSEISKKYDEINEIIKLLFLDFYGKSEPSAEVTKKYYKQLGMSRLLKK